MSSPKHNHPEGPGETYLLTRPRTRPDSFTAHIRVEQKNILFFADVSIRLTYTDVITSSNLISRKRKMFPVCVQRFQVNNAMFKYFYGSNDR